MYCTKKITSDVTWVGGSDRRLSIFEGVYPVPRGVSYNSYILQDEKTVLLDTVDKAIAKQFFENVEHVLAGRALDYIVIQHMEPDHSATLADTLLRYPDAVIVCTAKTDAMIKQFFDCPYKSMIVGEGDELVTGRHKLRFVTAPMVHWPEVMVTYDEFDKILFSADAFGTFGALEGPIFADEVDFERDFMDEARRYYANIVGKYGAQVQSLLKKLEKYKINIICPLHGYAWRKNLSLYIDKYKKWSSYTPEEYGVAIVFGSIYGNTENAADILACRLADAGIKTAVYDVAVAEASEIVAAAFKYSHLVFASATQNNGIFVTMEEVLRDLAAHNFQNRTVALIQNGSWAPASGKLMREILIGCKNIEIIGELIDIRSSLKETQLGEIDALVQAIADTMPKPAAAYEINPTAFFKISYGLFVLTAKDGGRDNGCIINTLEQLTSSPNRITISVNKQNHTHDMIMKSGKFNVSVLTESSAFDVFKQFGFCSGRDTDKFRDDPNIARSQNGLIYTTRSTNAFFSGRVVGTHEYGTHTLFVAEVSEARVLSDEPAVTYAYYFAHIKPKPQPKPAEGRIWICKICGYVYDEAKEGIPFDKLPDDWTCPVCKHPKSDFELQVGAAGAAKLQTPENASGAGAISFAQPTPPAGGNPSLKKADEFVTQASEDVAVKPEYRKWVCGICGYVYDEAIEIVPFDKLPDDWTCPLCRHPKSVFTIKEEEIK